MIPLSFNKFYDIQNYCDLLIVNFKMKNLSDLQYILNVE